MAKREKVVRDGKKNPEEEGHQKKRAQQPQFDQFKTPEEGVVNIVAGLSPQGHAALLDGAQSDEHRADIAAQLQRSYGNAYVQRLLSSRAVQAKLTVSQPDDEFEREADRVADAVTQVPASQMQRQEEEEEIQAKLVSQIQRQVEEEEEELLAKPASQIQRQEEEEEVLAKPASQIQRQEEEEEVLAKPVPQIQRQEEEEEVQAKLASQIQRQPMEEEEEEEEEVQAKLTSQVQRQEEEEEEVLPKSASQIQRQEEEEEMLQPKPAATSTSPLVHHQGATNVVQRGIWDKIVKFFGGKKSPEDEEIDKAEKKANALTKKHRKIVKKMEKVNDQYVNALEKGKFDKADKIYNKFEKLSEQHDKVRDEAEEAVNDYSQKVIAKGDKISDLISQDITGTTKEDLKEADKELDKLSQELEERKSTLSTEGDEFNRILDSIKVTDNEIKEYKKKQEQKEKDEYQKILDSIVITQNELKEYINKLKAKEAKEKEKDKELEELQIPTSKLGEEKEEEQKEAVLSSKPASDVQRQPLALAEDLETRINTARGSGQPLDDSVRAYLEPQFQQDFSDVTVHTDTEANKLSQQLGAEAFTTGKDVFFREGAYQPESEDGQKLIAHEVTHVVQQTGAVEKNTLDRLEEEKARRSKPRKR